MKIEALQAVTDDRIWARGLAYFREGQVIALEREGRRINALVAGSEPDPYDVSITIDGDPADDRQWSCNCPMGVEAELCKHVVAVCVAAANEHADAIDPGTPAAKARQRRKAAPAASTDALSDFLKQQRSEVLAERLLAFAGQHKDVDRELRFWMATAQIKPGAELRKAVSGMLGSPRWLDWKASNAYAHRLSSLLIWLRGLVDEQPAVAADACLHALLRLFVIYERADDSGGAIGDQIRVLAGLHAQACVRSELSPKSLSAAILKLQLADQWGVIELQPYVSALGATGLEHYGSLLEHQWHREQAGRAGAQPSVRHLLEDWYAASGQVDALITLQATRLNHAHDYLRQIDTCNHHERPRQALQWAERAAKAFPDDPRVLGALAQLLQQEGFLEEALPLRWRTFEHHPGADAYLALRAAAGDDWMRWRERALGLVRHRESRLPDARRVVGLSVVLLMAEQSFDEAYAAVSADKCDASVLVSLAKAIQGKQPERAATLYRRVIEAILPTRTGQYGDVIKLLKALRPLIGDEATSAYASRLRDRYRAKRRFAEDLVRAKLILG